jgi:hypothetical protein
MIHRLKTFATIVHPLRTTFLRQPKLVALGIIIGVTVYLIPPRVARAANITVNDTGDAGPGNCTSTCTLRDAITVAAPGDTISFSVTGTITLTAGQLSISKNLTVNGPVAGNLTVSGNNTSSIFNVSASSVVTISNLTITGGNAGTGNGGNILNAGNLTLTNDTISNGHAAEGGGIYNTGVLLVIGSTITGNVTTGTGTSDGDGGGVRNTGASSILTLVNSTVTGNTANLSNIAADGGGLRNSLGTVNLISSTIYSNQAGGNGANLHRGSGTLNIRNSIVGGGSVSGGALGPDVLGKIVSQGYALIQNVTDAIITGNPTNITGRNPSLGALGANGGITATNAELTAPFSPAIDTANPTGCLDQNNNPLTTDQRGSPRPAGLRCDIGAYELQGNGTARDTIGVFRPTNTTFFLRNSNSTGNANLVAAFGQATDIPVVGDWNGDGIKTIGIYRPSTGEFQLKDSNAPGAPVTHTFVFGAPNPGDIPLTGNWTGSAGGDGVGLFRSSNGLFQLKNVPSAGPADFLMVFGSSGDLPVAGDWNNDGHDSVGIFRPAQSLFFLTNQVCSCGVAAADYQTVFGSPSDTVLFTGDWFGYGISGLAVYRNGMVMMKTNPTAGGFADLTFTYGISGDKAFAGHWVAGPVIQQLMPPTGSADNTPTPQLAPTFIPQKR